MYVNTSAEVKAQTDYCCTSANAVEVVERVRAEHGEDVEILFGPDMWLGTYVEDGGVHILGTGGMLNYVREHPDGDFIVATETGMLHPLRKAAPRARLTAVNPKAVCKYMKMITLPKLRDSLRQGKYEVKVPADIAAPARIPIERMVAIG